MTRRRILFVDDEPNVLEGLRNLLRKQRHRWDMTFAEGGAAALAELDRAPFDVIVTDMRMPVMDGAALLARVKEAHPAVVRMVLSGDAEREVVLRALSVAHQYLGKPCDADALCQVLERACALLDLLGAPELREAIGRMDRLPSVPRTYVELTRAIGDARIGVADVARIVETDPAMSAKVLQLANSAFFGAGQRKTSVVAAVSFLGLELLRALALTAHVFGALERAPVAGFSLERLQRRSLHAARLALKLAGGASSDEVMAAALVHELGRVVLAMELPDRYAAVVRDAAARGLALPEAEREALGVDHASVGGYLLGLWGLPTGIVELVAGHHAPGRLGRPPGRPMAVVHAAAVFAAAALPEPGGPGEGDLDEAWLAAAGLGGELERWRALAAAEAGEPSSGPSDGAC